jgi:hypothetical protein
MPDWHEQLRPWGLTSAVVRVVARLRPMGWLMNSNNASQGTLLVHVYVMRCNLININKMIDPICYEYSPSNSILQEVITEIHTVTLQYIAGGYYKDMYIQLLDNILQLTIGQATIHLEINPILLFISSPPAPLDESI